MSLPLKPAKLMFSLFVLSVCFGAAAPSNGHVKYGVVDVGSMVKELRLSAPIRNDDSLDVFAAVEGTVTAVLAEAGQVVKIGDPLIQIDQEDAESDVQKARLKLEDARCEAIQAVGKPEDVRRKQIGIELAEIEYSRAQRLLARHTVRAPRAGRIDKIPVSIGDFIGVKAAFSQGTKVASIVGDKVFNLHIVVNERDVPRLHVKQAAKIVIDAIPGLEAMGEIVTIDATPEQLMGPPSFPVSIRFRTISPDVKIGMTGSVVLRLAEIASCLRVPIQAIRLQGDQAYVIVANPSGAERRCNIKVGIDDGDKVEVIGDLKAGDQLVLVGV